MPANNKRSSPRLLLAAVLCCALPCQSLFAQENEERSWNLGLALGHGERDNPLISGESININAVVDFSWYGDRFFFDNGDFGFTLQEHKVWSVSLIATVNNERNYYNYLTGKTFGLDSVLDNRLGLTGTGENIKPEDPRNPDRGGDGNTGLAPDVTLEAAILNENTELPERDYALNGGVEFLYISPFGDIQAQALTDLTSVHNGQEFWLSWSKPWYTRNSELTLTLGLEWKSQDLLTYYYGVLPEESFAARPAYEAGSGTNHFIRLAGRHRLSEHWSLVGMVEREYLGSTISNSPVVDRDSVDTFFAGLYYSF